MTARRAMSVMDKVLLAAVLLSGLLCYGLCE